MAHWISSKLKAAETLLQQIDQQAADSLGKNDKPLVDDQLGPETLPRTPEAKPLLKDQLKKKAPENVVNPIINHGSKYSANVVSKSNSDINRDEEARASISRNVDLNASKGLTDNDWTELLSVPGKSGSSGAGSSNGVSGIGGLKINGKKVRTSKSGLNLSAVDRRSEKGRKNGSLKNLRKSNVGLANNANVYTEEKTSSSANVTPRSSSVQSPDSGGELNQRDSSAALVLEDNSNGVNFEKHEMNGGITDGMKLTPASNADHSLVSLERKLNVKVGSSNGERMKSRDARNELTAEKATSLTSDEGSNSNTDTTASSDSESEREREERRKRRQQILAEKAAAKAVEAIKERENFVAKLEGEKQSLEKILEERAKQQVKEASDLQTTMMETMEAVELEKQKHNNTRMEMLSRLTKLERENADLARSLANIQKNLGVEVDRVAELRQQIHMKEATQEELRRKTSISHQTGDKSLASKGVEFELEMLKAEYSFTTDKVGRMLEKVKTLETSIETIRRQVEDPTEVEIELKRRLGQLTDHLIQKQAQVETLSSEKATLHFRIEAVSRSLDENKAMTGSANFAGNSSTDDLESGVWQLSNSKLRPFIQQRMQSGQQHLGSLVRQLDSLYCTGAVFLRRNPKAKIWCVFYLVCLHLWVMYILMSHSPVSDDNRSGAAVSLENINSTGSI